MNRRGFIKGTLAGAAAVSTVTNGPALLAEAIPAEKQQREMASSQLYANRGTALFPADVPGAQWARFAAEGYAQPACGVVYRSANPVANGMPLGGVATGCLDLDTDGTFGYCTLFNSGVPTRGPLHYGFLGLSSAGRTWLLSTRQVVGIESAKDIRYWGHYPIADLEYDLDGPIGVGLRAWSPFIPGDSHASNTPAAVFEVHVRNHSRQRRKATVALSFPGPTQAEAQIAPGSPRRPAFVDWFPVSYPEARGVAKARTEKQEKAGNLTGWTVTADTRTGYALSVMGAERARFGSGLWNESYDYCTGQQWMKIASSLPRRAAGDFSAAIAADVMLNPGESKILRFILAWYSPIWQGQGDHLFTRRYTLDHPNAQAVTEYIAANHASLLRRILAWQQTIYTAGELPVWMRESLVNILHLMTKTGYWAVGQAPLGDWCEKEKGLFGMSECPRECPQIECIPCSFYGNVPLVYFFPDLAHSTLTGYKAYQYPNGAPPWIFGGCTGGAAEGYQATDGADMATPSPGYQNTLNGPCYVDMFDRYWQRTGDNAVLKDFYPSLKKAVIYTINLRPGPEGIISVPAGDRNPTQPHATPGGGLDWFEGDGWFGMTPHVGGIHLAMLRMMVRIANQAGDAAFAHQCQSWIQTGESLLESKLWNGRYYLAYSEPETHKKSDLVFAYQLDGEWMTEYHGLPGVFEKSRLLTTLATIRHSCIAINRYGAANFARPSASTANPDAFAAWGVGYGAHGYFPPEVYMLGSLYIYKGERETGLKIVRSCLEGIAKYGYLWTQPNVVDGRTGKRVYGADYYQNMILWCVPAALEGKDIHGVVAPGSLVDRVLQAGRSA